LHIFSILLKAQTQQSLVVEVQISSVISNPFSRSKVMGSRLRQQQKTTAHDSYCLGHRFICCLFSQLQSCSVTYIQSCVLPRAGFKRSHKYSYSLLMRTNTQRPCLKARMNLTELKPMPRTSPSGQHPTRNPS